MFSFKTEMNCLSFTIKTICEQLRQKNRILRYLSDFVLNLKTIFKMYNTNRQSTVVEDYEKYLNIADFDL